MGMQLADRIVLVSITDFFQVILIIKASLASAARSPASERMVLDPNSSGQDNSFSK